jgi:cysteine dioxygenase
MAEVLPVEKWVEKLCQIPEREFTLDHVQEFLNRTTVQPETLEPYFFFSQGSYTRNLIYKCPLFEMIAICWEVGQMSRIHNHREQNCWMAVPIGRLRVQNFRVEARDPAHSLCRLIPTDAYDMDPGHPAAVDPAEPVHQVLNLPEFRQRAVSLHVYSRPFASCEVYSLEKGTYMDVPLHYTSEYGKLSPEEKLA